MTAFDELADMIITGQHTAAGEWSQAAIDAGVDPVDIIDRGMIPGMDEIGRRWKEGFIHMPEVLIAARAMTLSFMIAMDFRTKSTKFPTISKLNSTRLQLQK